MFKSIILSLILLYSVVSFTKENEIIIASTTSTYDSGLLDFVNKHFINKYNINIKVIAVGTGQAIKIAQDGNADILLVHHKDSELKFMNEGYGLIRHELMYNDYILVGPKNDKLLCDDFKKKLFSIYSDKLEFISRGDDSGTHKKEVEIWQSINLDPKIFNSWYLDIGQGMGNALLMANQKFAYTLSDRGTWLSFNNKNNLKIICEKFPPLLNQYGLIIVNPIINPNLNTKNAQIYVNWLISKEGKDLINKFKIDGEQLFFFNN